MDAVHETLLDDLIITIFFIFTSRTPAISITKTKCQTIRDTSIQLSFTSYFWPYICISRRNYKKYAKSNQSVKRFLTAIVTRAYCQHFSLWPKPHHSSSIRFFRIIHVRKEREKNSNAAKNVNNFLILSTIVSYINSMYIYSLSTYNV